MARQALNHCRPQEPGKKQRHPSLFIHIFQREQLNSLGLPLPTITREKAKDRAEEMIQWIFIGGAADQQYLLFVAKRKWRNAEGLVTRAKKDARTRVITDFCSALIRTTDICKANTRYVLHARVRYRVYAVCVCVCV
jgi:hypothetical protein